MSDAVLMDQARSSGIGSATSQVLFQVATQVCVDEVHDICFGGMASGHVADVEILGVTRAGKLDQNMLRRVIFMVAPVALALTELGLRGANLTRIESRPSDEAWSYRFFVDLVHPPGPEGLEQVIEPVPATLAHLLVLGSYRSAH